MEYRLQVFRRVAEMQSASGAARVLRISQPAVTRHIRQLEEEFSTNLFSRSRSGMVLTAAGAELLEHARKVEALDDEVYEKIGGARASLEGHLRVGASTTVCQYYLPRRLSEFKLRHPSVRIEILQANSEETIGALLAGRIDMGLIEAPCRRKDLRVTSFFEDEIAVIASPQHPLSSRRTLAVEQLLGESLVVREAGSGTRLSVEMAFRKAGANPASLRIAQELPSTEAIKRAVASGLGIGFVSRLSIDAENKNGTLAVLKVRGLSIRRPFSVIFPLGPDPVGLRQVFTGGLTEK